MGRVLVLDFDGTMTDAEVEGAPYRAGYLEDLAALTGLSHDEVNALAEYFERELLRDPQSHGWEWEGRIVAPAVVDPYLRMIPVARRILDHAQVFLDPRDRARLLESVLYKHNYARTGTAFREGAAELLFSLRDHPVGAQVWVVTNSHTEAVCRKISALAERAGRPGTLDWLLPRVVGRARKYIVDEQLTAVPSELHIPGMRRPVLLRRRFYHDVLARLLAQAGAGWAELLVVGDIFELDLCLPLAMGAQVALVANGFTPEHERAWLAQQPRARVLRSLDEVAALAT